QRVVKQLLATLLLAATPLAAVRPTPAQERKPMVVVISLDAFGAPLLHDPWLPTPTLHSLMQSGAWATSMQPVNPTVTWPNHTAMVTGVTPAKHGLIANGLIHGQRTGGPIGVEFHADKSKLVHVPTVYDEAKAKGLVTAEMDWVAVENAGIDYSFFEQPVESSKLIQEMIASGDLKPEELKNFNHGPSQPYRDRLYTRAAVYAIKHHHPSLTLLHLLTLDGTEHAYGYKTQAGDNGVAFLDDQVKEVVNAVREAGDLDRTTFLIVSDHGQSSVHHTVDPNTVLKNAGIQPSEAAALAEGGATYIYETHANAALTEKIKAAFAASPATDTIPSESEMVAQGWPRPANNDTAPDVIVYAKEDWKFGGVRPNAPSPEPQTGAHGYPNTRPLMQEIFIASGAAIKPHAGEQPSFPNLDVAATIAKILGLSYSNMDGKPLTTILK
ncbi:alkaline phosphatase family protein, partial [Terriglobus sp. ADX1]|uniref:alkaline phosphatase family protein n=1 Tax=Terriglobus sp. ADX1 TaxID=2794063 RepID=UPI002FE58F1C